MVNDTTRQSGFKKALDAAWAKIPELFTTAFVAVIVFGFGLWVTVRDSGNDIIELRAALQPEEICKVIRDCAVCENLTKLAGDTRDTMLRTEGHIISHNQEADAWKRRVERLEQHVFLHPNQGSKAP